MNAMKIMLDQSSLLSELRKAALIYSRHITRRKWKASETFSIKMRGRHMQSTAVNPWADNPLEHRLITYLA